MVKLKAIIFDLDDTLHIEIDYVRSGLRAVANFIDSENRSYERELWDIFLSSDRARVFNKFLEQHPDLNLTVDELVRTYRQHFPQIELSPCVTELLNWTRSVGLCTGLISDGLWETQRRKVDALHLEKYIDQIILTGQWGVEFWKPHERAFLEIEQRLGLRGQELVYIADNVRKDFIAPKSLDWRTVQFRAPRQIYSHLEPLDSKAAADHVVTNLEKFQELVRSWI